MTLVSLALRTQVDRLVIEGGPGPGKGKSVVLLAGDEEYRSEEMLPQLAKILAKRHGFKCTVLFSLDRKGEIDPTVQDNQPGLESLGKADLCIVMLRFRRWPDAAMRHFDDYVRRGKPVIGIRTATHAFAYPKDSQSPFAGYSWDRPDGGFGKRVLGETWLSHWGQHGVQGTMATSPGSKAIWVTTDVYEAHPPPDADVVLWGTVTENLERGAPAATGTKRTSLGTVQGLNDPRMPVAWCRTLGGRQRVFTTTLGSATDLLDEGFRDLLVERVYWCLGLKPPSPRESGLIGDYKPSNFGFGGYRKGKRPSDYAE